MTVPKKFQEINILFDNLDYNDHIPEAHRAHFSKIREAFDQLTAAYNMHIGREEADIERAKIFASLDVRSCRKAVNGEVQS